MPTMKSETRFPALPPLVVDTGQLSTVAWVANFVTRNGRPMHVLDAPAEGHDRGVRFEIANTGASPLFVAMYLPLVSAPGPLEARGMPGGLFDPAPLRALDGLGGSHEPTLLTRKKDGLHLVGPTWKHVLPAMEARFPTFPTLGEPRSRASEPLNVLRERVTGDMAGRGDGKNSMPENALAALAVLDRVAPATVTLSRHDRFAHFSCQWNGLGCDILLATVNPPVRGIP